MARSIILVAHSHLTETNVVLVYRAWPAHVPFGCQYVANKAKL
jgi:hypothetical protein